MNPMKLLLGVCLVVSAVSCVDNEQSFYIEHAKMLPDPPECSVSAGDDEASFYGFNLFLADAPHTSFSVTNAIMSQEDYGRLRAESNGILVDGYEVYTLIPGVGTVGGTEYVEYNTFLPAESTDILFAELMSSQTITQLRNQTGCTRLTPKTIGDAIWNNNAAILNRLRQMDAGLALPATAYAVVRFLGHTQGGKEVETQEFSIALNMTCGIKGGWANCIDDVCTAFCNADANEVTSCSAGLYSAGDQQPSCSDYLTGLTYTEMVAVETGDVDANGNPITEMQELSVCESRCAD